jgi:hypothetical protein
MNPLDQLADILPPDTVSIWPLAWGYWLVLVIIIVLIGFGIFGLVQYRNKRRAKREALKSLAVLDTANEYYAHKIQVLMKTLCTHYLPMLSSTQMHGEEWKSLVVSIYQGKETSRLSQVIDSIYQTLYYPKIKNDTDFINQNENIKDTIEEWIKSSFPCKNEVSKHSAYHQTDDSVVNEVRNV